MAEIKSTIDLVMEKTRGLTLSDEERKQIEEEKDHRRAGAMVTRYLQGGLSLDELLESGRESGETFRTGMLSALTRGVRLGRPELSRAVRALEQWKGTSCRAPLKRLQDLSIQFGKALNKRRKKVRSALWEELARKGVEGSAVEPNVEASRQWTDAVEELEGKFATPLGEIKNALLSKVGGSG